MDTQEHPGEAQALPGVRVGQIWREVDKRKGQRERRRFEVTGLGLGDVYGHMLNPEGLVVGGDRSLARETFELRYVLVSEGGAPDA